MLIYAFHAKDKVGHKMKENVQKCIPPLSAWCIPWLQLVLQDCSLGGITDSALAPLFMLSVTGAAGTAWRVKEKDILQQTLTRNPRRAHKQLGKMLRKVEALTLNTWAENGETEVMDVITFVFICNSQ